MKTRHTCFKCKRKFYEEVMEQVIETGKNGVAYKRWKCLNCKDHHHRHKGFYDYGYYSGRL